MFWRAATVRVLAPCVIAGAVLVAAPAPAATPAEVKYGNKIFSVVNTIRVKHDRPKLTRNKCLQRFATKQAKAMADQERLFHQPSAPVVNQCGLSWYGENVAFGPFTAKEMVQEWMKSTQGHRENILRRQFKITGVAARRGGGYWWAAQVFGRR